MMDNEESQNYENRRFQIMKFLKPSGLTLVETGMILSCLLHWVILISFLKILYKRTREIAKC
jgi:hypothetical protein